MATTPPTLNLTLGTPTAFSPFIPGLAPDYASTMTATVLSTAGDATLSVADPSRDGDRPPGQRHVLAQTPLQVSATSTLRTQGSRSRSRAGGPGRRLRAAVDAPDLRPRRPARRRDADFKQTIAGTEALRTGAYAKTLTFTLSTATP